MITRVVCDEFPQVAFRQTDDIRVLVLLWPLLSRQHIQNRVALYQEVSCNRHPNGIKSHSTGAEAGEEFYEQKRVFPVNVRSRGG